MTLEELELKYSWQEIGRSGGDGELHRELFTPFLTDIFENKIVYYERFMCVAILENIKITPEKFEATAIPYLKIKSAGPAQYSPQKPWTFGSAWPYMTLHDGHFSTYGGQWLFWTDKELVKTVEELALKKEFDAALNLTVYKWQ